MSSRILVPDQASEKRKATRRYQDRYYEWLAEQKAGPCADCGGRFHPSAMDFDHRPSEKKLFSPGSPQTRVRERVLEEIAKCDLVCANCHRVRTWARAQEKKLSREPAPKVGKPCKRRHDPSERQPWGCRACGRERQREYRRAGRSV